MMMAKMPGTNASASTASVATVRRRKKIRSASRIIPKERKLPSLLLLMLLLLIFLLLFVVLVQSLILGIWTNQIDDIIIATTPTIIIKNRQQQQQQQQQDHAILMQQLIRTKNNNNKSTSTSTRSPEKKKGDRAAPPPSGAVPDEHDDDDNDGNHKSASSSASSSTTTRNPNEQQQQKQEEEHIVQSHGQRGRQEQPTTTHDRLTTTTTTRMRTSRSPIRRPPSSGSSFSFVGEETRAALFHPAHDLLQQAPEKEDENWKLRKTTNQQDTTTSTTTMAYYLKHHGSSSSSTKHTIYDEYLRELQYNQAIAGDSRYNLQQNKFFSLPPLRRPPLQYGFVLKELLQRLLGGNIPKSNVLIKLAGMGGKLQQKILQKVSDLNHSGIAPDDRQHPFLEDWWWSTQKTPSGLSGDIRLAFWDLQKTEAFRSKKEATKWLSRRSSSRPYIEYIVARVTASTGGAHYSASIIDKDYQKSGRETILALIQNGYKVQVLAASDYWNSGNPMFSQAARGYGPNTLLDESTLDAFYHWGARSAALSKALVKNTDDTTEAVFHAFLFATRSLDLAIPSRREHIEGGKFLNDDLFDFSSSFSDVLVEERRKMIERIPFAECSMHSRAKVEFKSKPRARFDGQLQEEEGTDIFDELQIFCDDRNVTDSIRNSPERSDLLEMWTSEDSESICVRVKCKTVLTGKKLSSSMPNEKFRQVACATRILHKSIGTNVPKQMIEHPNLLVVAVGSLSRTQFDFILPRTKQSLKQRGFVEFKKYSRPSDFEQRGIFHDDKEQWLWNRLRDMGYMTFQAEDTCPTRKSIKMNSTHGDSQLFCFHFSRPNCVGQKLAVQHLLDHASQFVTTYQGLNIPWAAFISVVDANEDTMSLAGILDKPIHQFIENTVKSRLSNTFVVLVSNSGLSRGSYFQGDAGKRESYEPLLYARLPEQLNDAKDSFKANAAKFVSPSDLYNTILDIIGARESGHNHPGTSLLSSLPQSRELCKTTASELYCTLLSKKSANLDTASPPSILSFYADIPRDHRFKQRRCHIASDENMFTEKEAGETCRCATSHREWYDCEDHPWRENNELLQNTIQPNATEYFALTICDNFKLDIDIHVSRQENLIIKRKEPDNSPERHPPNILFLEIDSVSVPFADRHLPLTRRLLRKYRMNNITSKAGCLEGLCGVEFTRASTVGPNSVSNQVAALSGCLAVHMHKSCFQGREPQIGDICQDRNVTEYGMRLQSIGPKLHTIYCPVNASTPFLYDIAKREGYITLFGEEFCYSGSPWVLQDNVFAVEADFMPHKIFCRLASYIDPDAEKNTLFKVPVESSSKHPCLSASGFTGAEKQKLGLDLIKQTWDAYPDVPKFAYLNAISAHTYESDWSRAAIGAEAYDVHFSQFLEDFLQRDDANNTILIIRSDHGFQGSDTATLDFSTQVEHRHPWTEMLVPNHHPLGNLFSNSAKTVTSFDFYKTVLSLMSRSAPRDPLWAYDLMSEETSDERDCEAARIPQDFCPSTSPFPTFGTCNMFEPAQAIFCQDPMGKGSMEPIDVGPTSINKHRNSNQAITVSKESKSQHRRKKKKQETTTGQPKL